MSIKPKTEISDWRLEITKPHSPLPTPYSPLSLLPLRWRKPLREMWVYKSRTLLVILSIAVGVFAFGTIAGAQDLISRTLHDEYLAINPASAVITTASPLDEKFIESVRQMPGVAFAEGRRSVPVRLEVGPNEWNDMVLIVVDDYNHVDVNIILPYAGAWPPPERTILIERKSLSLINAAIGDEVRIKLPNGRFRTLPITGLTHDMNQPPTQISGIGFGYISEETLDWLELPAGFDQLQIRVDGNTTDVAHIEEVVARVEDKVEKSGRQIRFTNIPEPDKHPAEDFLPTIILILGVLGTFSLLLSGILIVNTLNAILKQQVRQIGIMKAVGARAGMVTALYFRMVILYGIAALFIALPLGAMGSLTLSRFVAGQLNFDILHYQFQPRVTLIEMAAGMFIPLIAAIQPVTAAARTTIREAISDVGISDSSSEPGVIDLMLGKLPISRPLRLSLRNTFRRKGRLALTLVTLLLGGAIFISVLTVRASLFTTADDTLASRGYDVQVDFSRPYRAEPVERLVAQVPGVVAVESWQKRQGVPIRPDGQDGEALFINALPPETKLFKPDIANGRWLTNNNQHSVVIHKNLLDKEPYLHVGGTLTLKIGDQESDWEIVGITQDLRPPLGPSDIYVPYTTLARQVGSVGQTDSVQVITAQHDEATHTAVSRALEAALEKAGYLTSSSQSISDDRNVLTERFNIFTTLLGTMSMLIATVGGLGLMGTMTMNVLERRREIGVMRALGASDRTVERIFISEGLVIGLLSWMGGMVMAQPMSRIMSYQIGVSLLQFPLSYTFSFAGAAIWLLVVLLISYLASYLPARNAANLRIREILAYE